VRDTGVKGYQTATGDDLRVDQRRGDPRVPRGAAAERRRSHLDRAPPPSAPSSTILADSAITLAWARFGRGGDACGGPDESLYKAIAAVKAGRTVSDIGTRVRRTSRRTGFRWLREFVGNESGPKMHESRRCPTMASRARAAADRGNGARDEPMVNAGSRR